jgi:hypothetical protein
MCPDRKKFMSRRGLLMNFKGNAVSPRSLDNARDDIYTLLSLREETCEIGVDEANLGQPMVALEIASLP